MASRDATSPALSTHPVRNGEQASVRIRNELLRSFLTRPHPTHHGTYRPTSFPGKAVDRRIYANPPAPWQTFLSSASASPTSLSAVLLPIATRPFTETSCVSASLPDPSLCATDGMHVAD
jgi:hypothetical protein